MADLSREIEATYVLTEHGTVLVQLPADNRWGFELADDDQTWAGGFGIAAAWEAIPETHPAVTEEVRERLGWLLAQR